MTPEQAVHKLLIPNGFAHLTKSGVKAAYARRVKAAHPDTGQGHGDIAKLQQARDLLLEALESQKYACKLCHGVGKVRNGMAWRECSACKGKGETR